MLDRRSVQLPQELASVGTQTLDVAALTLRVERIKGQGRLPRPTDAREHDQLPLGNDEPIDLQIVCTGTEDFYLVQLFRAPNRRVGTAVGFRRCSLGGAG